MYVPVGRARSPKEGIGHLHGRTQCISVNAIIATISVRIVSRVPNQGTAQHQSNSSVLLCHFCSIKTRTTACIYFYADYRTENHLVVLSSCSHDESSLPDRRNDFVDAEIAPRVPQFKVDARGEVVL